MHARGSAEPIRRWLDAGRPAEGALEAWKAAVAAPRRIVVANGWKPYALVSVPIAVFVPWQLDLSPLAGLMVVVGALIAVAYASVLHFFASEVFLRPVVQEAAGHLPNDFGGADLGVPVRWRLLAALPIINVITGVVVSGLNNDGASGLADMGVDVVIAVLVAFTVSLELTVLVTKSVMRPVDDLLEATRQVKTGDLQARAKLTSGDELGVLAGSFNEMMAGVSERDALRDAFGSYVDPDVAERVLDEGALLEGMDVEATVMVVDMRDFTPFAERSSAQETVTRLNELFEVVVPVVLQHGGHANKFLGDGLLAVFGTPERFSDHADRALAAGMRPGGGGDRALPGRARGGRGHQLRARGRGLGRRRRPAGVRGDRRRRQRRRARGGVHEADGRLGAAHRGDPDPARALRSPARAAHLTAPEGRLGARSLLRPGRGPPAGGRRTFYLRRGPAHSRCVEARSPGCALTPAASLGGAAALAPRALRRERALPHRRALC